MEYEAGRPPPRLVTQLPSEFSTETGNLTTSWGSTLDDTDVEVERVIAYWSRTLKEVERRYSTTEREALAAKEGLVKFQPFIKGEKVTLVTDHTALQWAKTYENSNRRLAAWNTVYSAYAPNLEIIHRLGRVYSNIDLLSRLKQYAPEHISPAVHNKPTLSFVGTVDGEHPFKSPKAQGATTILVTASDLITNKEGFAARTRSKVKDEERALREQEDIKTTPDSDLEDLMSQLSPSDEYSAGMSRPPSMMLAMDPNKVHLWVAAYEKDQAFQMKYKIASADQEDWSASRRYFKDADRLLYFRDADFHPRLCVPLEKRAELLTEAHECWIYGMPGMPHMVL